MVKLLHRGPRLAGSSLLVFAAGPTAILGLPWLEHARVIAPTPLWLLVALLVACSTANAIALVWSKHCSPGAALQLRSATAAISTAWVVYATGWGSLLVIGYAVGIADAMRAHGSRAWRPALAWTALAIALGETGVALGWAPTVLRPTVAHSIAVTTFICLVLVVRTLGSSAELAESATQQVERGRTYFKDLVQHAADVIALVSADFRLDYISPGIESLVGLTPGECIGLHIGEVLGRQASDDIIRAYDTLTLSDYSSCEWQLTNEFGEQRQAYARLTRRDDGSLVLNIRDITEQRALEAQLLHRASVDALTGLPNRSALTQQLARGSLVETTVLFIDLDGFKEVNDSLGHERGDSVLRDVAHRIAADLPPGATAGRLGGDEFLTIVEHSDVAGASAIASRIIAGIEEVGATLTRFPLSASIGIATGARDETPDQLLRRADEAMYRAKAVGPGRIDLADLSLVVRTAREGAVVRTAREGTVVRESLGATGWLPPGFATLIGREPTAG